MWGHNYFGTFNHLEMPIYKGTPSIDDVFLMGTQIPIFP